MAREGIREEIRERCNLQTTKRTEEVESRDLNSSTGVWVVIIKCLLESYNSNKSDLLFFEICRQDKGQCSSILRLKLEKDI